MQSPVPDALVIRPQFSVTAAKRQASSRCCGAKLNGTPSHWTCRECGKPCDRVMSDPQEVIFHG